MKQIILKCIFPVLTLLINACSGTASRPESVARVIFEDKELTASGSSVLSSGPALSRQQLQWMAEQLARMNAYRSLATQLYQEKLPGGKTAAEQVMRDEAYRIYLDIYLRDAKLTGSQVLGDSVSANMALSVTPRFYHCMAGDVSVVQQCLQQDNKLPLTRLGNQISETRQVNLMCGQSDCSGLYHVSGFDRRLDDFDQRLLNAGLYDKEWLFNTSGRLLSNALIIQGVAQ